MLKAMVRRDVMLKWLWISALIIIFDQISKQVINHFMALYDVVAVLPCFNVIHVHNTGAAFSFLSQAGGWQRWFFAGLAVVISGVLAMWLARLHRHETLLAVALSLILGGAIGNLIDRVIYGYVIDFIDFYYQDWHFAAFNVADAGISIGVGLLLLESFGIGRQSSN